MSYPKGKDIKVPFDCLWHCMTRSFQATSIIPSGLWSKNKPKKFTIVYDTPKEFDKF